MKVIIGIVGIGYIGLPMAIEYLKTNTHKLSDTEIYVVGHSKGGNLVICYLEEDLEKSLEISFSKKLINKLKVA